MIELMQLEYRVPITIVLRPTSFGRTPRLGVSALAYTSVMEVGVAEPLAWARRNVGGIGGTDIPSVALAALYDLENRLVEMSSGKPTKQSVASPA